MGHETAGRKTFPERQPDGSSPLKRRGLMFGLGAAGAVAVAIKLVPGAQPVSTATPASKLGTGTETEGGYRLSAHVKRYYETTRS